MRSENATKCKTLGIQLFQNWRKDRNDLQKYSMGHTHPSSRSSTLGSSEGSSLCSSEGSSTLGSSEGSSWGSSEGSSEGEVVKVSGHCKTSSVRTIILQTEIHWPSVWCMHGNKQALPLLTIKYIYISARNQSSRNDKEMTDYWIYIYIYISMWFSIYIYTISNRLYSPAKSQKICEHVLSEHIRLLDEKKIPVLDARSRFTGKVDKLDSSFGVWRQGHSEGALTAKNALLTPQVGSMVGQGQQSESLALSRRPTPGPHPQAIKIQMQYPSTPAQKGQGACLSTARIPSVPELWSAVPYCSHWMKWRTPPLASKSGTPPFFLSPGG